MGEVYIENHNMCPTFYRFTSLSFHVNWPSDSSDTTFPKFDLENSRSRSWVRGTLKSQSGCNFPSTHTPLFHVNRPSRSWDTAFSKFDLGNPRSRWWVRCTLKITTWVQHSIDSHPFHSMSIGHPIPDIRIFQKSKVKVMGEGNVESHKVGVASYRLTFFLFHVNRPFLSFSKFDLENTRSRSGDCDEAQLQV